MIDQGDLAVPESRDHAEPAHPDGNQDIPEQDQRHDDQATQPNESALRVSPEHHPHPKWRQIRRRGNSIHKASNSKLA